MQKWLILGILLFPVLSFGAAYETKALDGRVTVSFPSPFKKSSRTVETKYGEIRLDSYKGKAPGTFMNLLVVTYPDAVMRAQKDPLAFIDRTAAGHEKQKTGSNRVYFRKLKDAKHPAAEHRFTYPTGKNSTGARYAKGFSVYRYYLVDSQMVTVFVDVLDGMYLKRTKVIDQRLEDFFASLKIKE
ncbi:MAG: hypothetical protein ACPGVU_05210 [Limisphaerales bacterium]